MKMNMVTVVSVLTLVGCGGLHGGPDSNGEPGDGPFGIGGGPSPVGVAGTGADVGVGGGFPVAGTGPYEGGGYSSGGTFASGGAYEVGGTGPYEGGGYSSGGAYANGGYEAGGIDSGGYSSGGGFPVGGTGSIPPDQRSCLQDVTHCFDAAANCYEYSPWSDCDQIVDVCSAMQATCND